MSEGLHPDGWGWAGSVEDFNRADPGEVLRSLREHHRGLMLSNPSGSQEQAWTSTIEVMREALDEIGADAEDWSIILEYELPLEGGRRPDVVVLAGSVVVSIEFKVGAALPSPAMCDQAGAYARDLAEYHEETYGRIVHGFLVPTRVQATDRSVRGVRVLSPDRLASALVEVAEEGAIDLDSWLRSSYAPLPRLVDAARRLFEHEPLPHVRRARSAGVPDTVDLIKRLCDEARDEEKRILAFVSGVPGSGKTLVGLRAVYEGSLNSGATFLSGNGPLVKVLKDALGSGVFVKDLHAYIRTVGIQQRQPKENIVVFDEAQRAWDRDYMNTKRGIERSEPELLLDGGARMTDWSAMIGLVGDGQEIHSGEEGGLAQWRDAAIASGANWEVHCPPRIAHIFDGLVVQEHEELDLTVSLRSREAEELHEWVQLVLDGRLEDAAAKAEGLRDLSFGMYVSRNLDEIRGFLNERYVGEEEARYGLVSSSHAKNLARNGVDNTFMATSRMNEAKWYNAPAEDPAACVQLAKTVTEFGCQGLELDTPVVCWGEDLRWENGIWRYKPVRRRYALDDPEQILENVYRVLLTRGRDGFVVWVPPDAALDETAGVLAGAGVAVLETVASGV